MSDMDSSDYVDPRDDVRLTEMDKDEWRDIMRFLRPDVSEEEYEQMWREFQAEKEKRTAT